MPEPIEELAGLKRVEEFALYLKAHGSLAFGRGKTLDPDILLQLVALAQRPSTPPALPEDAELVAAGEPVALTPNDPDWPRPSASAQAEIRRMTDAQAAGADIGRLPVGGASPSTLDVILEWYQTLLPGTRAKLSLANLHDLSKRLSRAPAPVDGVAGLVGEFREWRDECFEWSGSAFLAGEPLSIEMSNEAKGALYRWLCKLGNYLQAWEDAALRSRPSREEVATPAALRGLSDPEATEAAYREFPDDVEPLPPDPVAGHGGHPAGRVAVNRGPERYGFLRGVAWAKALFEREGS